MALFENITKKIRSALSTYGLTPPADKSLRWLRHPALLEVYFPEEQIADLSSGSKKASLAVQGTVQKMGQQAAAKLIAAVSDDYFSGDRRFGRDREFATLCAAMLQVEGVKEALKGEQQKWWRSKEQRQKITGVLQRNASTNFFRQFMGFNDSSPKPVENTVERLYQYAKDSDLETISSMLRQTAPDVGDNPNFKAAVEAIFVHTTTKKDPGWDFDSVLWSAGPAVIVDSVFGEEKTKLIENTMTPAERRAFLEKIDRYDPAAIVKLAETWSTSQTQRVKTYNVLEALLESPKVQKWVRTNQIEERMPPDVSRQFRGFMKRFDVQNEVATALGFNQKTAVTPKEMDRRIDAYVEGHGGGSEGLSYLEIALNSLVRKNGDCQPFAQAYVRCAEKNHAGTKDLVTIKNEDFFQKMQVLADGGQDAKAQAAETAPRVSPASMARINFFNKTKGPSGR